MYGGVFVFNFCIISFVACLSSTLGTRTLILTSRAAASLINCINPHIVLRQTWLLRALQLQHNNQSDSADTLEDVYGMVIYFVNETLDAKGKASEVRE